MVCCIYSLFYLLRFLYIVLLSISFFVAHFIYSQAPQNFGVRWISILGLQYYIGVFIKKEEKLLQIQWLLLISLPNSPRHSANADMKRKIIVSLQKFKAIKIKLEKVPITQTIRTYCIFQGMSKIFSNVFAFTLYL